MEKVERYFVTVIVGVLGVFGFFFLFWWGFAAVAMAGDGEVNETLIKWGALAGLAVGIGFDVLFLRRIVGRFYQLGRRTLVGCYIAFSVAAVASFMGVPIGNLILGGLAGIYIGRRYHGLGKNKDEFQRASRRTGVFTGMVTAVEALAIGVLALTQESSILEANELLGFGLFTANMVLNIVIVLGLCIVLFIMQYAATRGLAKAAY